MKTANRCRDGRFFIRAFRKREKTEEFVRYICIGGNPEMIREQFSRITSGCISRVAIVNIVVTSADFLST